jgi:hypothetical protein
MDIVIPIVFPDYKILVEIAETNVDLIPGTDRDNFKIPGYKNHVSELGHAGVLFIQGSTGLTQYYEYGRYDLAQRGEARRRSIPDVRLKSGRIEFTTLKPVLAEISRVSGQHGRIQGAYIEVENKFSAMLDYSNRRVAESKNPKRAPYALLSNSCLHFVKGVLDSAGVNAPMIVDPRPNGYVQRLHASFLDLEFASNVLTIENKGRF